MAQLLLTVVRSSLHKKNIILLSSVYIIVYKAGKRTGVENTKVMSFTFSVGTYSTDDFNAKINVGLGTTSY